MRIEQAIVDGKHVATIVYEDDEELTPRDINQLPNPIRRRLHRLAAFMDPAGYVQELAELKMMVKALENRVQELEG